MGKKLANYKFGQQREFGLKVLHAVGQASGIKGLSYYKKNISKYTDAVSK